MRSERCEKCGSWQRMALDYGHCWSGDRLDGDFAHGPADLTYPGSVCEAFWPGAFDPDLIRRLGGDPGAPFTGGRPFRWTPDGDPIPHGDEAVFGGVHKNNPILNDGEGR